MEEFMFKEFFRQAPYTKKYNFSYCLVKGGGGRNVFQKE